MSSDLSVGPISVSTTRRLAVGLIGSALVVSGAFTSVPAHAGSDPGTAPSTTTTSAAASDEECLRPARPALRTTKWRHAEDTTEVSAAEKAQVASVLARTTGSSATSGDASSARSGATAATLPSQIRVPVFIHVIHGNHKGEKRIKKRKARRMYRTLRYGFAGAQNSAMANTGVVFDLRKIRIHRNEKWFHAKPFSRADKRMKRKLHRGKARALNIYVNRPKLGRQLLLGFATFPWKRVARTKLDGVNVSEVSLPGGRARGYNLGDTVIHETGHWLGLLHTCEGGCSGSGDWVWDTPAEAGPSFTCPIGRDSCPAPEPDPTNYPEMGPPILRPDPVQNFMDYSYDSCMNHFTPGQRDRMIAAFVAYRAGR